MPENVESLLSKSSSQLLHHPGRRARFPNPRILDRPIEERVRQTPARDSAADRFLETPNAWLQIMRSEMPVDITRAGEGRRNRPGGRCGGRHLPNLLLP